MRAGKKLSILQKSKNPVILIGFGIDGYINYFKFLSKEKDFYSDRLNFLNKINSGEWLSESLMFNFEEEYNKMTEELLLPGDKILRVGEIGNFIKST